MFAPIIELNYCFNCRQFFDLNDWILILHFCIFTFYLGNMIGFRERRENEIFCEEKHLFFLFFKLYCLLLLVWLNFFLDLCVWIFLSEKLICGYFFLKGLYWAYWFLIEVKYWVIIEVICEIGKPLDLWLSSLFFYCEKDFFVYSLHFTFTKKNLTSRFIFV